VFELSFVVQVTESVVEGFDNVDREQITREMTTVRLPTIQGPKIGNSDVVLSVDDERIISC
jgi:hypothetical protein